MTKKVESSVFSEHDSTIERIIARLIRWFLYVGLGSVILMMLLTVIHAVGRYFFNSPISGLDEFSSFLLVIIIFTTAVQTEVQKRHIAIEIVSDRFPRFVQAILNSIMYLLALGITVTACWVTIERGFFIHKTGYFSQILEIPHYPFVFFTALGWFCLAVVIFVHLIHYIKNCLTGGKH